MERAVAERANPYSPPDHGVRPLPRQSSGAATVLLGVLLVELALRAFRATLYLAVFFRWEGYQNAILTLTPGPLELSWALTWPLLALVVVSFSVWVFRANRDARSLGAKGMFFSAGWSAGIAFVPVANLIGPYRSVKEIYQASDPNRSGGEWVSAPVPSILPMWWGFWLMSIVWNIISQNLGAESTVWSLTVFEILRALRTEPPESGQVVIDFNKAYNPPCAYNPYTTCPMPTKENRLEIRIEAGEKNYKKHS